MKSSNVVTCPRCGKLFSHMPGKSLCVECLLIEDRNQAIIETAVERHKKLSARAISEFTGLPIKDVQRIVRHSPSLRHLVDARELCTRCGELKAERGSDFCLSCRFDLYRAFGDAADDLFTHLEALEPRPQASAEPASLSMSVISALNQKRSRAGMLRFHPAPMHRIR